MSVTPDLDQLPPKLKSAAAAMASKIVFERLVCDTGGGYLLFGTNKLLARKVVVKFYYWGDGAHAEPKILSDLACEHVIQVLDAGSIDNDDAYFVTPFCEGGDLERVIAEGRFGPRQAIDKALEIVAGVSFIHAKGYIHRDLKPSNIFFDEKNGLLVGDFGSVIISGSQGFAESKSQHSLLFRPPEEVKTKKAYPQGDIYQIGMVLFNMLGGYLPSEAKAWLTEEQKRKWDTLQEPENQFFVQDVLRHRIVRGKILDFSTLPPWCSVTLKNLIRKCCRGEHTQRFESASALAGALSNLRSNHPDWRVEEHPTLYQKARQLRIVSSNGLFSIQKRRDQNANWRTIHALKPKTLGEAVKLAEQFK